MGKVIFFVVAIIMIDILLLGTGQMCIIENGDQQCSLGSIVFNGIVNLADLKFSEFFRELVGDAVNLFNSDTGFTSLIIGGIVTLGAVAFSSSDNRIFIPIAVTLGLLTADWVFLFKSMDNILLGTLIFAPLAMAYILTVLDWIRGKD